MPSPYRLSRRPEQRVRVLGAEMDLVRPEEVFHFAKSKISANQKALVANHNLHSLYLMNRDSDMRRFFARADLIEFDSLPILLWARLIGRPSRPFHRCTYLDWRNQFWDMAIDNGWRIFFVGGEAGVAERARANILQTWPRAQLQVHHGYFDIAPDSPDNQAVIEEIRAFKPDIILVGMGMPRQETWILRNYDALPTSVMFTVGGAFDYEAGAQVACPRWLGRLGLEWLFRLAMNPRRLFTRYCIEPWRLAGPALRDLEDALDQRLGTAPRRGVAGRSPVRQEG